MVSVAGPGRPPLTNGEINKLSRVVGREHSKRPYGEDPKLTSNCAIYTFDVMQRVADKDGVEVGASFQRQWMNAYAKVDFDGKDLRGKGPAHALGQSGLGYEVCVADGASWDQQSRLFQKGDFVQLQHARGGHQGILQDWGVDDQGRPWMSIRGFQHNREVGGKDVNVKRVSIKKDDGDTVGEYQRAIVARYDPHRDRMKVSTLSSNDVILTKVRIRL